MKSDFVAGAHRSEQDQKLQEQRSGVWHGSRISPQNPAPGDTVDVLVTVGVDISADRVDLLLTRDGHLPDEQNAEIIPFERQSIEWTECAHGYVEMWTCSVPTSISELWRYRIRATTPNEKVHWADVDTTSNEPGEFAISIDEERPARWLRDAVIYTLSPKRFAAYEESGQESSLRKVTSYLEHVQALGANVLHLTPLFPSQPEYETDQRVFTSIDPGLGTMEEFDGMVAEARQRGIRIVIDLAASATELDSPGDDSNLDTLANAAKFWMSHGVDGFLFTGATATSIQFITRLRRELRRVNSDVAVIFETSESPEVLKRYRGRIDGFVDLCFRHNIHSFMASESQTASDFWRFYQRNSEWFRSDPILMNSLDGRDNSRFLSLVSNDTRKLKIAALLQMSLPDPAAILYGTETGLYQPSGSENDASLWKDKSEDRELLEFYRSLVFWRKKFGITRGNPRLVHAGEDGTLIFITDSWLVVINRNDEEIAIDIGSYGTMWLSLATDNGVKLYGSELVLPAYTGAILANELAR